MYKHTHRVTQIESKHFATTKLQRDQHFDKVTLKKRPSKSVFDSFLLNRNIFHRFPSLISVPVYAFDNENIRKPRKKSKTLPFVYRRFTLFSYERSLVPHSKCKCVDVWFIRRRLLTTSPLFSTFTHVSMDVFVCLDFLSFFLDLNLWVFVRVFVLCFNAHEH